MVKCKVVALSAILLSMALFTGCGDNSRRDTEAVASVESESTDTPDISKNTSADDTNVGENVGVRDETLKGRGLSDSGREEPRYENVIGYVVILYDEYSLTQTDTFTETPWSVPVYGKEGDSYVENGSVERSANMKFPPVNLQLWMRGFELRGLCGGICLHNVLCNVRCRYGHFPYGRLAGLCR